MVVVFVKVFKNEIFFIIFEEVKELVGCVS